MSDLRLGLAANDNIFVLKYAEQLAARNPEEFQLQLTVSDLKGRVEGPIVASDYLESRVVAVRTHRHALYLLAKFNIQAGRKAKASEYLTQLRQMAPNYPVDFNL